MTLQLTLRLRIAAYGLNAYAYTVFLQGGPTGGRCGCGSGVLRRLRTAIRLVCDVGWSRAKLYRHAEANERSLLPSPAEASFEERTKATSQERHITTLARQNFEPAPALHPFCRMLDGRSRPNFVPI